MPKIMQEEENMEHTTPWMNEQDGGKNTPSPLQSYVLNVNNYRLNSQESPMLHRKQSRTREALRETAYLGEDGHNSNLQEEVDISKLKQSGEPDSTGGIST